MDPEHQTLRQDEASLRRAYVRLDRLLDEWLKWVLSVLQCSLPLEVPHHSREASRLAAEVVQYLRGTQNLKVGEVLNAWKLRTQLLQGVQDNVYFFTAFHIILWEMGQSCPSEKVARCWQHLTLVCKEWLWSEVTDTSSGESTDPFKRSQLARWRGGNCWRDNEGNKASGRGPGWEKPDDDDTDWETEDGDEEETDYDEDVQTAQTFENAAVYRTDGEEEGEDELDEEEKNKEAVWQECLAGASESSSFYLSSRAPPYEEDGTGESRSPQTQSVRLSFSTHKVGAQRTFGRRQRGHTEESPVQLCEGGSTDDEASSNASFNEAETCHHLRKETLASVRITDLAEGLRASRKAVGSLLGALCPGIAWADASWTVSWGFTTLQSVGGTGHPEKSPFRGILVSLSERRFGCYGRQLVRISLELDDKCQCFYRSCCQQGFFKNEKHPESFAEVKAQGARGDKWKGIELVELRHALEGKVDDGFEYEGKLSKLSRNRFYRGTRQTISFSAPVAQRREEVFESWNPRALLQMVRKKNSPMALLLYLRLIREELIVPWSKATGGRISISSESGDGNDDHLPRMCGWSIAMAVFHGFIHALVHHTFHSLDSFLSDKLGISVKYTGRPGSSASRFPLSEALMLEVIETLVQISVGRNLTGVITGAGMEKENTTPDGASENLLLEGFKNVGQNNSEDLSKWPRCKELLLLCERRSALEIFPRGTAAVLAAKSLLFM